MGATSLRELCHFFVSKDRFPNLYPPCFLFLPLQFPRISMTFKDEQNQKAHAACNIE